MSRQETMVTRYGEFIDLLSCLSIYEGNALPKTGTTKYDDFEQAMKLR